MVTANVLQALIKTFSIRHCHVDVDTFVVVRFGVTIGVIGVVVVFLVICCF